MKKVLILGAGLVARPMVTYLLRHGISLTIASPMPDRAEAMINGNSLGAVVDWSMDDPVALDRMIREHDITVSLLPYRYHTDVAKNCIRNLRPLVTTSYVQPGMKLLESEAKNAGVLLLNETGLDPGIDHMSAMKVIDHIHGKGGRVAEFVSLCGALPANEAADNPLKYKFTWSPKGVVLASCNSATYLRKGLVVNVESAGLFRNTFLFDFPKVGTLEVYPNRDSLIYRDIYGIPEAQTVYRGTLRFSGWCESLDAMKMLGMLDSARKDYTGMTYREFIAERAGTGSAGLKKEIASKLGIPEDSVAINSLEFLGMFSDESLGYTEASPFDITSDRMIRRMMLGNNERDMVVMQHIIVAEYPDGKREMIKSSMLDFGTPSTDTAISRTVALPAAIAVRMILEKRIGLAGVYRPVLPEIYNPVLEELKDLGIEMKEEYGLPAGPESSGNSLW
ncbi:MAG: saccharopine dehydrogenase C-terminal domain-containing protein [Bacteroidales bacterium]